MRSPWTSLRRFLRLPTRRTIVRPRPTRQRLCLDSLEDRIVPTIVFEPHFGAESATYNGGAYLGDTPVYLLYWGSYWNTSAGAAQESQFTSAIKNELNSPIYNRMHSDYGGAGGAYVLNTWTATETTDPQSNGFSDASLQNAITAAINDGSSPILSPSGTESVYHSNAPVYWVITPPGTQSGFDTDGYDGNYTGSFYSGHENAVYGWAGNGLLGGYSA